MRIRLSEKRELYSSALMIFFGATSIVEGRRLGTGDLTNMGPGYVPAALGALLIFLGAVMAITQAAIDSDPPFILAKAQWRGWSCIILGVLCFVVLGRQLGFIAGAFSCVFVSALGDRTATPRGAALLAVGVTVFGILLFSYVLQIPIPLISWGSE